MLAKERVIESIKQLPENFSLEEVFERILLLEKIETGIKQSNEGEIILEKDLDKFLPEWLV